MSYNPYLEEIKSNLPRLLALFDRDSTSQSHGMGDRYFWAWGLIDFGNGTFQGAAHGMARLWTSGLWPYPTSSVAFLARISAMIQASSRLIRRDGSLEEAFPHEGSYCVTALVAFDLLCTMDLLDAEITSDQRANWNACIRPMIGYLTKADETHALISNHLATAVAALTRWHRQTDDNDAEEKAKQLMDRILSNQSQEGWFCEYGGADPGYQSLCTYYLADVHRTRPDWNLFKPLLRSIRFLQHFAHPDGSFGGLYGSRCTRFYYPAGVIALSDAIPEANSLSSFMEVSIAEKRTVTLSAIDEPNLIPMFNAYAWAAAQYDQKQVINSKCIPATSTTSFRRWFPEAGLLIDRGTTHYSLVSTHKGGVVYHFIHGKPTALIDAGIVIRNSRGQFGSTQGYNTKNNLVTSKEMLQITAQVTAMPKKLPSPQQFLLIRLLGMTAFRSRTFREWIKRLLVKLLITRKNPWPVTNHRQIRLGLNLSIQDRIISAPGYHHEEDIHYFVPIHMASQGYWQMQDEQEV